MICTPAESTPLQKTNQNVSRKSSYDSSSYYDDSPPYTPLSTPATSRSNSLEDDPFSMFSATECVFDNSKGGGFLFILFYYYCYIFILVIRTWRKITPKVRVFYYYYFLLLLLYFYYFSLSYTHLEKDNSKVRAPSFYYFNFSYTHLEQSILNLVKSNQIWSVNTHFSSEKCICKYNSFRKV